MSKKDLVKKVAKPVSFYFNKKRAPSSPEWFTRLDREREYHLIKPDFDQMASSLLDKYSKNGSSKISRGESELEDNQKKAYNEMFKEAGLEEKTTHDQDTLVKEQIKLTHEQQRAVEEARKQALGSNPVQGAVQGIPVQVPGSGNQEAIEKAQEDAEAKEQIIEEETEAIKEAVEEEKEHAETKIANIPKTPKGLLGVFSSSIVFIIIGIIDSLGSVGIAGDITMFVIMAIFWLIPSIILFDVSVYFGILSFLVIDLAVGLIAGSLSNLVLPVFLDMAIDFLPELVVLLVGATPSTKIMHAYQRKIPDLIAKIRQQSKLKIAQIRADGKQRIKFALARMRGHFSGVASEGRKLIFFIIAVFITVSAQVYGLLGIEGSGPLTFMLVTVLGLVLLRSLGMLGNTEFVGVLGVIVLNIVFRYLMQLDQILSSAIGATLSFATTILFGVACVLFVFKIIKPDRMPKELMIRIMLIVALLMVSPFMYGFVTSGQAVENIETQSAEQQIRFENFNFAERMTAMFDELYARGSGDYVPAAEQEYVHEYIGVKVADIDGLRDEFIEGQPIDYSLYYSTGSLSNIRVGTYCYTGDIFGEVQPSQSIEISQLFAPPIICTFWSLPKGTHTITFETFYDYKSHIEIPLVFMSRAKNRELVRSGGLKQYETNYKKPRTSSGPIDFKVYTYKEKDVKEFKMPLVYDLDNLELAPILNIELDNPIGDSRTQGELKQLKRVVFETPEGLEVGNCNFQNKSKKLTPTNTGDGRWEVDITKEFDVTNPYKVISCRLYVNEKYKNTYFPIGQDVTYNTLHYYIEYTYLLQQKQVAKVV